MSTTALNIQNLQLNLQQQLAAQALPGFNYPGFRAICTIKNSDGRKTRSDAGAKKFDPRRNHIDISFEPIPIPPITTSIVSGDPLPDSMARPQVESSHLQVPDDTFAGGVTNIDVSQCCNALGEAERSSLGFVGVKRFLEYFVTAKGFAWAKSVELRHKVLTKAVNLGQIETYKVANPKNPEYPTTAIRLRRSRDIAA